MRSAAARSRWVCAALTWACAAWLDNARSCASSWASNCPTFTRCPTSAGRCTSLPPTRKPRRDSVRARTSPAYSVLAPRALAPTVISLTERIGSTGAGAGEHATMASVAVTIRTKFGVFMVLWAR
ncbi:hypothetical protein FQZ97_1081830 [compost metagenome]